ncbi:hypothetical protein QA802_40195 [Streptomyces sp. B21-105]|uniref:hypothetical protein n=1 Tax=Streptomyces sp. B21-105 TaxID=3039417 RepID=UPI002FF0C989
MSADPRISTLATDVARFSTEAEQLVPAQRLRLVAQLRDALEAVTGQALDAAMSAAKSDGWELRSAASRSWCPESWTM